MRLTISILSIMFCGLAVAAPLAAQESKPVVLGDAYSASGDAPVFSVELGMKEENQRQVLYEKFTDRAGNVVASTEATYESGRLATFQSKQQQSGESATVEIKNGKVHYSYTVDGKTKQSSEKDSGNLVPLVAIPQIITSNWDTLSAGKEIEFSVPIPERQRSIGIQISKERTWTDAGRTLIEFKREPSNRFFRTLIDPDFYVFDAQQKTIVEYRGRTEAKSGTPKNWEDFTGRIVYRSANTSGSKVRR